MKRTMMMACTASVMALGTPALADCAAELAEMTEGVTKDGGLAPLQTSSDATEQIEGGETGADATGMEAADADATGMEAADASVDDGEVIKDGSTAPLNAESDIAMSGQDAQAQQEGGETAAAQPAEGSEATGPESDRQAALDRAQAALDAGDEEACMSALEEARAM